MDALQKNNCHSAGRSLGGKSVGIGGTTSRARDHIKPRRSFRGMSVFIDETLNMSGPGRGDAARRVKYIDGRDGSFSSHAELGCNRTDVPQSTSEGMMPCSDHVGAAVSAFGAIAEMNC